MAGGRDRFNKVLAVAINPGSYEQEAIAANRARILSAISCAARSSASRRPRSPAKR
jgi:hypothetical protein